MGGPVCVSASKVLLFVVVYIIESCAVLSAGGGVHANEGLAEGRPMRMMKSVFIVDPAIDSKIDSPCEPSVHVGLRRGEHASCQSNWSETR